MDACCMLPRNTGQPTCKALHKPAVEERLSTAWPVHEDSGVAAFLQLHAANESTQTSGTGGERRQLEHPRPRSVSPVSVRA